MDLLENKAFNCCMNGECNDFNHLIACGDEVCQLMTLTGITYGSKSKALGDLYLKCIKLGTDEVGAELFSAVLADTSRRIKSNPEDHITKNLAELAFQFISGMDEEILRLKYAG